MAEGPKFPGQNKRVKDEHKEHDLNKWNLSHDMESFMEELSADFPNIRITSGRREGNENSHHHTGNAVDFGREHSDVYHHLMNTEKGLSLMAKYGLGIIDETDPATMQKTGATGPHYHLGPDSKYVEVTKRRLEQFDNAQPIFSFYSQNPNFDYSDISSYKVPETKQSTANIKVEGSTPFELIVGSPPLASQFLNDVKREQKKEKQKEERFNESDARQALKEAQEKKKQQEQQFVAQALEDIGKGTMEAQQRQPDNQQQQQQQIPLPEIVPMQQGLPNLPTIFTLPEFQGGGEFIPHYMYDQQGNRYFAAVLEDHLRMQELGYVH